MTALATAVREHASKIERRENDPADTAELIRVLARIVEGKPLLKAFGAPGDWGYNTPIGDGLAKAYGVRRAAA